MPTWWDDDSMWQTEMSGDGGKSVLTPETTSNIDVPGGITNAGAEDVVGTTGGSNNGAPTGNPDLLKTSEGVSSKLTQWAKDNKEIAAALAKEIMGAIGGAGVAGINRGTMERKAELELQNAQALRTDATARSSANAFRGGLGMSPSGNQVIARAGGAPVYDPASGQIKRPGLIHT